MADKGPATPDLSAPELYLNRELSFLEFNRRVKRMGAYLLLDLAPACVQIIKRTGQTCCLIAACRRKQSHPQIRGANPPTGIDPRSQ